VLVLHKVILPKSYKRTAKLLLSEGLVVVASRKSIVLMRGCHEHTDTLTSVRWVLPCSELCCLQVMLLHSC